ncbi:DinB family protein [Blastococcus sp. TF02A-35]|uniref:DinB family protein n=1 Tax=Blastococcus sp. TF02A-35 TaxID=2559612 RepID=UPI001074719A|nr:DinB family protein [Blastococcus sp. TF02A_35]TFV51806.1 DinB family protein [Blastococcus sp. TF02A_35]
MASTDEQGRPEPPEAGDEVATLLGFLDFHRATLAWKTRGLGAEGLRATVGASTLTLGGLLKHLAVVEDSWFRYRLHGRGERPRQGGPWDADPDHDWNSAAADPPEDLRERWAAAVACSRELVAEALAEGGLDRLAAVPDRDGRVPSLRWIVVHMIEEYARHNGHADLIREAVDGEVGE